MERSWILAAAVLSGCATAGRGAEDAVVVGSWPAHVLAGPSARLGEELARDPTATAVLSPLLLPWWALQDSAFTAVHAVDLALLPLHAPFGGGPLGLYDLGSLPPRLRPEAARALEECLARTVAAAAVPAGAWAAARGYGPHASSWSPPADP
jgi:hypothetical protein